MKNMDEKSKLSNPINSPDDEETLTDWRDRTDQEIEKEVEDDPDAAPILSDEDLEQYIWTPPGTRL